MNYARLQPEAEKPQQELRFTVRDPILDEALVSLEEYALTHSEHVPQTLFLYAMKRMNIDLSDTYDGYSQNKSTFQQYRRAIDDTSNRGQKRFKLDNWMHELRAGGPGGALVGVEMRVHIDPNDVDTILSPPLVGPSHHKPPITEDQIQRDQSALRVLQEYRHAAALPVRYEIGRTAEDPTEALERLKSVLALGVWVSQLTIVAATPRAARSALRFMDPPIERTFTRIDTLFEHELMPYAHTPDDLASDADQA